MHTKAEIADLSIVTGGRQTGTAGSQTSGHQLSAKQYAEWKRDHQQDVEWNQAMKDAQQGFNNYSTGGPSIT
jgi:hypothetical protein